MSGEKLYIWRCSCGEIAGPGRDWAPGLDRENTPYHQHGDDPHSVPAEKVEVVPADAPNVLSQTEAEEVIEIIGAARPLVHDLVDWVVKERFDA